jgi:hypothetical protein
LQMSLIGPLAEKIQTYERDLYGIVASTQAELAAAPGTQSKRTIGTSRPLSTVS